MFLPVSFYYRVLFLPAFPQPPSSGPPHIFFLHKLYFLSSQTMIWRRIFSLRKTSLGLLTKYFSGAEGNERVSIWSRPGAGGGHLLVGAGPRGDQGSGLGVAAASLTFDPEEPGRRQRVRTWGGLLRRWNLRPRLLFWGGRTRFPGVEVPVLP